MNWYNDKTIVITGAAGVLCREMALSLANKGARVALIGRTEAPLNQLSEEIKLGGGMAFSVQSDVLNTKDLRSAQKRINQEFGPCDVLINGAGGNHTSGTTSKSFLMHSDLNSDAGFQSFFDLDEDGVMDVFNLNFLGTFLPIQVFAKDMVGRKGCSILNISSIAAEKSLTKVPAYSASKAAISNFTMWLSVHLGKEGIRVNALAPGFFLTTQNSRLLTNSDGSLSERGIRILDNTPMGRFGEPKDLIGALHWLCGDEAKFVTGIVVPIDGGFTAYSGV